MCGGQVNSRKADDHPTEIHNATSHDSLEPIVAIEVLSRTRCLLVPPDDIAVPGRTFVAPQARPAPYRTAVF